MRLSKKEYEQWKFWANYDAGYNALRADTVAWADYHDEMKRRENITGWDRDPRLCVGLDRAVIVRATRRASEGLYEPRDSARAFFATIAFTNCGKRSWPTDFRTCEDTRPGGWPDQGKRDVDGPGPFDIDSAIGPEVGKGAFVDDHRSRAAAGFSSRSVMA